MSAQGQARVTVVTPVYNGRDYIAETVDSVLAQTDEPEAVVPWGSGGEASEYGPALPEKTQSVEK